MIDNDALTLVHIGVVGGADDIGGGDVFCGEAVYSAA